MKYKNFLCIGHFSRKNKQQTKTRSHEKSKETDINRNTSENNAEIGVIDDPGFSVGDDFQIRSQFDMGQLLKMISQQLNSLNGKISTLDKKVETLDTKVETIDKKVETLDKKVETIDKKVETIDKRVETLDKKVGTLDEKVIALDKRVEENFKTLDGKISQVKGNTDHIYEMVARNEIAKRYGQRYSENFEVYDLNGLVRLIAPKDKILPGENMNYSSQAFIQDSRADKIARHIFNNNMIEKFEEYVKHAKEIYKTSNSDILFSHAKGLIEATLKKKGNSTGGDASKRSFLIHEKFITVMVLTSQVTNLKEATKKGHVPFLKTLEIDVRGDITDIVTFKDEGKKKADVTFNIEIGEIKHSEDAKTIRYGIYQLSLRLAVMGYALNILYPELRCNLIGNLFTPKTLKDFTIRCDESIIYTKKDKGFNYYVKHVTI